MSQPSLTFARIYLTSNLRILQVLTNILASSRLPVHVSSPWGSPLRKGRWSTSSFAIFQWMESGWISSSSSLNAPRTTSITLLILTLLPLLIPFSTLSSHVSPLNATILKVLILKLIIVFWLLCPLINNSLSFPLELISASMPRIPLEFIVPIVTSPLMIVTTVFHEGVAWMVKALINSLVHLLFVTHRNYFTCLYFLVHCMLLFYFVFHYSLQGVFIILLFIPSMWLLLLLLWSLSYGVFYPFVCYFMIFVFSCCAPCWGGVLTFSGVRPTQCVCHFLFVCVDTLGASLASPIFPFYIHFLTLYHHQYMLICLLSSCPCPVFQQKWLISADLNMKISPVFNFSTTPGSRRQSSLLTQSERTKTRHMSSSPQSLWMHVETLTLRTNPENGWTGEVSQFGRASMR